MRRGDVKICASKNFMICCSEICVHLVLRDSGVLLEMLCYTGSFMLEDCN